MIIKPQNAEDEFDAVEPTAESDADGVWIPPKRDAAIARIWALGARARARHAHKSS